MACGINKVKIGKANVDASKVSAALDAAEKADTYVLALEAGFLKMPKGVTASAWEKWFKQIHDKTRGANITEKSITGSVDAKSTKLKNLLNMEDRASKELLPETISIIETYKERILERKQLLDEDQVDTLIEVIENVIWANNMDNTVEKSRTAAIKNINTKLGGDNEKYYPHFRKLLNIPLKSIKDPALKVKYLSVLEALSNRSAVLNTVNIGAVLSDAKDVLANVQEIPKETNEITGKQTEKHSFWKERFKAQKIVMPKGITADERRVIKFAMTLKDADLDVLTDTEMRQLSESIDNLNGGIVTGTLNNILWTIKAHRLKNVLKPVVMGIQPVNLSNAASRLYGAIKGSATKKRAVLEIIRSSPKTVVDEVFGSKGTTIFQETFNFLGQESEQADLQNRIAQEKTDAMKKKLAKSFKGKHNKITRSTFKLKIYEKTLQHETNPDEFSAMDYVKRIFRDSENGAFYDQYSENILNELIADYAVDGEFSREKLEASLTDVEKEVLLFNRKMNEERLNKELFVSGVLKGKRSESTANYSPNNEIIEGGNEISLEEIRARLTGIDRDEKLVRSKEGKAPLISLDVLGDTLKATKQNNIEYYMTEPVRVINRGMDILIEELKDDNASGLQVEGARSIQYALIENIDNVIGRKTQQYSAGTRLISKALKHGYAAQLASFPRAAAELISNLPFALIKNPRQFMAGMAHTDIFLLNQDKGLLVMKNLKSIQISKLFSEGSYSSRFTEGSFFDYEATGNQKGLSPLKARMRYVKGVLLDNKIANAPEKLADILLSTPDKLVSRPLYFGTLATKFKDVTGKEIDFTKIAANDEAYMEANADALKQAGLEADSVSIQMGATNNGFAGISKLDKDPTDTFSKQAYKYASGYLMRFMIHEASTFKTGVLSLVGQGRLTPYQGFLTLAAASMRLSLYFPMYAYLSAQLAALLGVEDEEEEEPMKDILTRDLIGGLAAMFTQGRLSSFPRVPINWGIEKINENYLGDLRGGAKYEPYKHSMVFSMITEKDFRYGSTFADFLLKFTGPARPFLKDFDKLWKDHVAIQSKKPGYKQDKLKDAAFKRFIMMAAGHTGFFPAYKDAIRIYNQQEYLASKKGK